MDLKEHEEKIRQDISQLLCECVRHGHLTFVELRDMIAGIVGLTRAGVLGNIIGERIRKMISPEVDIAEVLECFDLRAE